MNASHLLYLFFGEFRIRFLAIKPLPPSVPPLSVPFDFRSIQRASHAARPSVKVLIRRMLRSPVDLGNSEGACFDSHGLQPPSRCSKETSRSSLDSLESPTKIEALRPLRTDGLCPRSPEIVCRLSFFCIVDSSLGALYRREAERRIVFLHS